MIAVRMEQMMSQLNQSKPKAPVSPQGSGILKTPPFVDELSKSVKKIHKNLDMDNRGSTSQNWNLPKTEFPWFDGRDPIDGSIKCKLFFDVYMVPEAVKPRMAILHFSGGANEWYKGRQYGKFRLYQLGTTVSGN